LMEMNYIENVSMNFTVSIHNKVYLLYSLHVTSKVWFDAHGSFNMEITSYTTHVHSEPRSNSDGRAELGFWKC
jgi:hypothetical protein